MDIKKRYIGKKIAPKEVIEIENIPESTDDTPKSGKISRSRHLYHLYKSVQRKYGKWVNPYGKDKRMRTCFKKLARHLKELEDLGYEIEDIDFILAQKAYYKDDLTPTRLISRFSLKNYENFMEAKRAEVVELTKEQEDAYDEETIKYLAELRGESPKKVRAMLESCGMM